MQPNLYLRTQSIIARPSVWLLLVLCACAALLTLRLSLAIGAYYWDITHYIDGGYRVIHGQTPSVDFFAPVGPLSYWLVAVFMNFFPDAQPLLLINWCMLPVSLSAMSIVLAKIERTSPKLAVVIFIPFTILQVLPLNFEEFTFHPSFDGFGIYNRQISGLLYVLVSALVFVRSRNVLTLLVAYLCAALFLLKITGFVVALLLCLYAWVAGRLSWREIWKSAVLFIFALIFLELATSVVSAYLLNIATLVRLNSDTLLWRWVRAASLHAGWLSVYLMLIIALGWSSRNQLRRSLILLSKRPNFSSIAQIANFNVSWLIVCVFAAWLLETQNSGGHAFVFVWPILWKIYYSRLATSKTIQILLAAAILTPMVGVLGRAARAGVASATTQPLEDTGLKTFGQVSQRGNAIQNAALRLAAHGRTNTTQDLFLKSGGEDSADHFRSPEFQVLWLKAIAEAVEALRRLETETGVRFNSILNVGLANPFPYLLDRDSPRLVATAADPSRTVPRPNQATLDSIAATDLLLVSQCPGTAQEYKIAEFYNTVIRMRQQFRLSPCWTAYPKIPMERFRN